MKLKFILLTIALSLIIHNVHAQEGTADTKKKSYEQAIDSVIDQLKKFKACVQGKKPCRIADFAVLGTGLLVIYGIVRGLRYQLQRGDPLLSYGSFKDLPLRGKIGRVLEYTDPAYLSEQATKKTIRKIGGHDERSILF